MNNVAEEREVVALGQFLFLEVPLYQVDAVGYVRLFVQRLLRGLQADGPVQHCAMEVRIRPAPGYGIEAVCATHVQHPPGAVRQIDLLHHLVHALRGQPPHGCLVTPSHFS